MPVDCHPDIITMAKPLANVSISSPAAPVHLHGGGLTFRGSIQGIPIGAIMMKDKVADVIKIGDHGTTFGFVTSLDLFYLSGEDMADDSAGISCPAAVSRCRPESRTTSSRDSRRPPSSRTSRPSARTSTRASKPSRPCSRDWSPALRAVAV
jgi:hypothetical protein